MEAVTDVVFRHVVAEAGRPDVFFTEFTNATGWHRAGNKAIGSRLIKTDNENPIVAQLWGNDPEAMAALSRHCANLGYDGIDINMGCPDQSAIKAGGGSDMIRHPDHAYEIIKAAKTSGLPVSVKTRLGYTHVDEWQEWLGGLLRQGLAVLTIHLRTKKEMSKVPAHFELIPAIKALRDKISPDTLLVINGDVRDREHGREFFEKFGVDGVMIGRGVFANPFAFSTTKSEGATRDDLINLLNYHLALHDAWSTAEHPRKFEPLKRFFKIYIRDFEGASELRDKLMHTKNTAEVRAVLAENRL